MQKRPPSTRRRRNGTDDFAFVADPPETSQGLFGWLGYEVNGEFFPSLATPAAATPTG